MPAEPSSNSDLAYADTLWKTADALRGQVDAAEYKHVVLGLLFLKYISDSFEARRDELRAELGTEGIKGDQLERLLENRDEYTAERVFWVPPEARWSNLQHQATRADIATLIDDAILAVERDNPNLKSKLPRDYARRGIEPVRLKGLIDLIADNGFKGDRGKARDTLGRVYEYFLGKFAQAEGKLGGEFYTPRCIVRLLVEMLEPYEGRVYDPCCGSGGMFVQSERFVEAHGGQRTDISIFGQESNPTTWRLRRRSSLRVSATGRPSILRSDGRCRPGSTPCDAPSSRPTISARWSWSVASSALGRSEEESYLKDWARGVGKKNALVWEGEAGKPV